MYDDKIEIYYNYIDRKRPDADEHQVFSFYKETFSKTYTYDRFDVNKNKQLRYDLSIEMDVNLYI